MDGDGIETAGTQDSRVILFDHNDDGIKTGTGWLKPDDGWLVLDRNGNGTIDSGRELFGVDTLKSNGELATDGFDALKELDANQDRRVDAADSIFANLRIWRDLNQDGISQANELTTLSANDISGIGVSAAEVTIDLGNGNVQTAAGTFTRSNGTTRGTGETNGAVANLDLLVSTFHRQFSDHIPLTDQARTLPDLRGSGQVRNLSEAISLSTDLGDWVQTYIQQTTRQAQIDRLDCLIEKWADTADLKPLKAQSDALSGSGISLTYHLGGLTAGTPAYDDFIRKLGVVERFMGFTYGGGNGEARFTPLDASSGNVTVRLATEQIANISLAYERFKTDIYESLLLCTRLEPIYNQADFTFVNGTWGPSWNRVEVEFRALIQVSPRDGIVDLLEFVSALGYRTSVDMGWNAIDFLVTQLNAASDLGGFTEELSSWTVRLAAASEHNLIGTSRPDLMVGNGGDDRIYGIDGADILIGKDGKDSIYAGDGNDLIHGGAGNDYLSGGTGNDVYLFGRGMGQDAICDYDGELLDSNTNTDTILFGADITASGVKLTRSGDDLLVSVDGADDRLTVLNHFHEDGTSTYAVENIRFADGMEWNASTVKAKVLTATGGNDTLAGYATNDSISADDGSDAVFGQAGDDMLDGGTGTDNIDGGDGNDTIKGGTGNDQISAGTGNDTLQGGDGDDNLSGDDGNDSLDGGTGNDYLSGGRGADVYLFEKGSGQDTVYNYDGEAMLDTNADILLLGAGITTSSIKLKRLGNDLLIHINGTDDSLTVQNYFLEDGTSSYAVENIKFADGTEWDAATVKAHLSTTPPPAGIAVTGSDASEELTGGPGDDTLYGQADNDTLDGGAGNDWLDGGEGNDTYLFGRGSAKDNISTYDGAAGKLDVIQLGAGIAISDVTLRRDSDALVLSINGTSDALRVNDYFYEEAPYGYQIEQIRFADGTTLWDVDTIKTKVVTATPGDDTLTGYATDDSLSGLAGDDTAYARAGNDSLDGGAGEDLLCGDDGDDFMCGGTQNDRLDGGNGADNLQGQGDDDSLYGRAGNDTLDGGTGNDWLDGGEGNDTYLFGEGSGKDCISAYDGTADKLDIIQLGTGIATTDVTLKREASTLVLSIDGTSDALRIEGYLHEDATSGYQVEEIRFADGTIWDINTVKTKVITATMGNDTLTGYAANDTLFGLAGDDTAYGHTGNDTLDGGAGNDRLNGGEGNDTYLFGKGSGCDLIDNYDFTESRDDRIVIGSGVSENQIWLQRAGDDLQLTLIETNEKLTVGSWYSGSEYRIDGFDLWNGTHLPESRVDVLVSAMAAFTPPAAGQTSLPADYQAVLISVITASWDSTAMTP